MSDIDWGTSIPYDALVKTALKQVAIDVLSDAAEGGLRGDHHFYVAFYTQHPGVAIPRHLKEKYPEEMTIVVQHRFWGLKVHDDYFEIGLSFNQRPERLVIPFEAIIGFVDPSVHFALQFEGDGSTDGEDESAADTAVTQTRHGKADQKPDDTSDKTPNKTSGGDDNKVVTLDAFRKNS